ncbi:MAG: tetratricopeptide repeat protein [Spirulina sp.]
MDEQCSNDTFPDGFSEDIEISLMTSNLSSEETKTWTFLLKYAIWQFQKIHKIEEAKELFDRGEESYRNHQFSKAIEYWENSLKIYQELDSIQGQAKTINSLGIAYSTIKKYEKALSMFGVSLEIARSNKNGLMEIITYRNLGIFYSILENYKLAFDYHDRSLKKARELNDIDQEALSLHKIASLSYVLDDYEKAIIFWTESLEKVRTLQHEIPEAIILEHLIQSYQTTGQYEQTVKSCYRLLKLAQRHKNFRAKFSYLSTLGQIHHTFGKYNKAINYYKQALRIAKGSDFESYSSMAYYGLGNVYYAVGNFQQALNYYSKSLAIAEKNKQNSLQSLILSDLGSTYNALGNFEKDRLLQKKALALLKNSKEPRYKARVLRKLGYVEDSIGQYIKAIEFYEQSLLILQDNRDPYEEALTFGALGIAYYSLNDYQKALKYQEKQLTISREIGYLYGEAASLGNLGLTYNALQQNCKALAYKLDALQISKTIGDRKGESIALNNLGFTYLISNQYDNAIKYSYDSFLIAKKVRFLSGQFYALKTVALAYEKNNNIQKALDIYQIAFNLSSPTELPREYFINARNFGNLAFKIKDYSTTITAYDNALQALEQLCYLDDSPASKQQRRSQNITIYENMVRACLHQNNLEKVLETIERSKARNLVELLINQQITPQNTPPELCEKLRQLRRDISTQQHQIQSLQNNPFDSFSNLPTPNNRLELLQQNLKESKKQLNQLLDRITKWDSNFEFTQRVTPISFAEIRTLLDEKTVLIEWYLTAEAFYAFIVTGDAKIQYWQSTPEDNQKLQNCLNDYLQTYRQNYKHWKFKLKSFLPELAQTLHLDEICDRIPKQYQKLILIPYRELHLIPFHALPLSDSPTLFEKFSQGIQYLPSCQIGLISRNILHNKNKQQKHLFAIQNPLEDLRYTNIEVQAIEQYFSSHTILPERQATKSAIINSDSLKNSDCLHFACHGSFNVQNALLSTLILAESNLPLPPPKDENNRYFKFKDEIIDREKCITLPNLFSLNLHQCNLVTLSACETGWIDIQSRSDEYIGLPSGVLFAGS